MIYVNTFRRWDSQNHVIAPHTESLAAGLAASRKARFRQPLGSCHAGRNQPPELVRDIMGS